MPLPLPPALLLAAITASNDSVAAEHAHLKAAMEAERLRYQTLWTDRPDRRDSLIAAARGYLLERTTGDMFPLWYGTPWDFNGTTRVPGRGRIACGCLVNTVLQDAGFRIPRVKWSQRASEPVTRTLDPGARSFRGVPAEQVVEHVRPLGVGLYKAGLDNHTGFLWNRGGEVLFVHSDHYDPATGVKADAAIGENPMAHSRYRVVGKLLNDAMVERWMNATPWD